MRDRQPWGLIHNHCILLGLSVTFSLAPIFEINAQLIPDNTLGKENSIVNPAKLLQRIDGGATRGSNLFHSFKEFNIDSGKSVYFSNPTAIQNILTRVTGKNTSNIFGKLGVLGNANLFLLNPNGIIFGRDASLDISGSFSATTSPSILFDNGFEFSTTNPSSVPLLKVNITPGLQYSRSQQADIKNQANLTVGEDLNLIGKNLDLTGELNSGRDLNLKAQNNLQIRDNSNNPFIVDAGRDLLLQANQKIDIFALNHPDSGLFSENDLILRSSTPVLGDARYFSGGSFRIEQSDGNLGDLESPKDPIIRASGDVSFDSYIGASLHILAGGSVNITGDVTITDADAANGLEETVTLSDGESLEIDGKNQATLDIRAGTTDFGTPGITGSGNFTPGNPNTGGSGSSSNIVIGGNIKVNTADGLVFLSNQYSPNTSLNGGNIQINGNIDTSNLSGNAGKIILDSLGNIDIIGSQIRANSSTSSSGNISLISGGIISVLDGSNVKSESNDNKSGNLVPLGNINLNATSIIVDNSEISATTNDSEAGDIILNASNEVKIGNNSKVASGAIGTGEAGFLKIITDKLSISDNSLLTVSSQDTEQPGFILIQAEDVTLSNKAEIFATTVSGDGGNIELENLKILQLTDGSLISASTTNGTSGNVSINATESINIDSGSGVIADATGTGKAGNINITTSQFNLDNGIISVSNRGTGNAGELRVNASNMKLDNESKIFAETKVETPLEDDGGDINLQNLQTLELDNGSSISASTVDGEGGDFTINATGSVILNGGSKLAAEATGNGEAGDLNIFTPIFTIDNSSVVSVSSQGNGEAGDLKVKGGAVSVNNESKIIAETPAGSGGEIELLGIKSLLLSNNSTISASTKDGEAGDVTVKATDSIQINSGSLLGSQASNQGHAGFVKLTADKLTLNDIAQVTVSSKGNGIAGVIEIDASDIVLSNQTQISATTELGSADNISLTGGDISLQNVKTLLLQEGSLITATTINGEAGNIEVNATDSIKLESGSKIISESLVDGTAGTIEITTSQFIVTDNSQTNVSSKGNGDAGSILINASDVFLSNTAEISAKTTNLGTDGNITLENLNSLEMLDSLISASTINGEAGDININTTDSIKLFENSSISSEAKGSGIAGELNITTNQFTINNSQANVSSKGIGDAGFILIKAKDVNLTNQGKISGTTESGIGGDITLKDLTSLTLNNSEISASTVDGTAGNLNIKAAESIELTGKGGLSVQSTSGGTAGSVEVSTKQFDINDEARITVSSPSGQAGNLEITADNLFLTQGILTAETGVGDGSEGANIILNIKDLFWIQNDSLISAEAFDTANGGNITINNSQGFVIGLKYENSDITANATLGNGGNIDITTQNIFGLTFREEKTSYSDITASSQFGLNGQVTVNQLNVNPAADLIELPSTLEGAGKIQAGCAASNGNNFVLSGKGGLPQSPDDLFSGKTTVTELFDLVATEESSSDIRNENNNVNVENPKNKIVEATGWVVDDEGSVIFVAKMPENNSQISVVSSVNCENFSAVSK